jgi:hypothetical protein
MRTKSWISLLSILAPAILAPALLALILLPGAQPARAMLVPEDPPPAPTQVQEGLTSLISSQGMCNFTPDVDTLLAGTTLEDYTGWISKLSGNQPWVVGDSTVTITTRTSCALFDGTSPAFDVLRNQLLQWYPADQVTEETYQYNGGYTCNNRTWKNLVLTIPGSKLYDGTVMLTAHFDDMPSSGIAPGADDNASGSATLLEAARLLVGQTFPRTVKIVWFTGEEQGLKGSAAYVLEHEYELNSVKGVVNLDMYAYDSDNDHCFEMHVGSLPASNQVGQCLAQAVQTYEPTLRYDYFTISGVTYSSDHAPFWGRGIGAVEIGENFSSGSTTGGCGSVGDMNIHYHQYLDTLAGINYDTAYSIHRSALAAFFAMASVEPRTQFFPLVLKEYQD